MTQTPDASQPAAQAAPSTVHDGSGDVSRLFDKVYGFMREGVMLLDRDGRIVAANQSAQSLLGLSLEQMRGGKPRASSWCLVKEDGSPFAESDYLYHRARATGEAIEDVTVGVYREDGSLRWLMLGSREIKSPDSPWHGCFLTTLADVTALRTANEAMREATYKLGLVVGAAKIGIWEWDPRSGEVIWDEQMRRLFGVPSDAPVTQDAWNAMVLPEDMPNALKAMRRALDQKRSTRSGYRIRRPDGKTRHMLVATAPLLDDQGRIRKLIGMNFDATQRILAEQALARSEKQLRALIDSVPGVITLLDRDLRYLVVNKSVARNFGRPVEEIEGRLMSEVLPAGMYERHAPMAQACLRGQDFEFNDEWVKGDKGVEYWHGQYVPFWENGEVTGYVCVALEVGELRKTQTRLTKTIAKLVDKVREVSELQGQLREQAVRDGLTGLYNRRYLDATLPRELANASRLGQQVGLLMLDIDYFKRINDSFGHEGGDAMLEALARLMQESCREGDLICRYGGEEFLILLPNMVYEDAVRRADEIRQSFASISLPHDRGPIRSTLSIGVASFPRHAKAARDLIRAADMALYSAKGGGRDRVVGYDPAGMRTIASMADHP